MYHYQYPGVKPKKKPLIKGLLVVFGAIMLVAIISVIIVQSGFFTITRVTVNGKDTRISQAISQYLKGNFIFLVSSPQRASQALEKKFPELQTVDVSMDIFSKTLWASYTLRTSHFLWCKQDGCFLVDASGIIFAPSEITQTSFLTSVADNYFTNIAIGRKIPRDYVNSLISLEKMLKEKNLTASQFVIDAPFSLKVRLNGAGELRFSFQKPINEQVDNFTVFYDSISKPEFAKLKYIDLRVKNKIYYQ